MKRRSEEEIGNKGRRITGGLEKRKTRERRGKDERESRSRRVGEEERRKGKKEGKKQASWRIYRRSEE